MTRAKLDDFALKDCKDVSFSFQVRSDYIKYILLDPAGECFPYTIEGKWHLNMTEDEEMEELIEEEIMADVETMSGADKEEAIEDNDLLVDQVEH